MLVLLRNAGEVTDFVKIVADAQTQIEDLRNGEAVLNAYQKKEALKKFTKKVENDFNQQQKEILSGKCKFKVRKHVF